jgi:hypothetical protein
MVYLPRLDFCPGYTLAMSEMFVDDTGYEFVVGGCYVAARVWEGERGLRGREKAGRGPFAHGRARGKGFPS